MTIEKPGCFQNLMGLAAAATLLICLVTPRLAQAQQTYEDGQGAVELSPSGETPVPPSLPARKGTPKVGRKAAEKYMGPKTASTTDASARGSFASSSVAKDAHYLALHVGTFISDAAYKWGATKTDRPGNYDLGVTYRLGEWENSMDLAFRVDYSEYSLQGGSASKLSFLPVISFPDANSHFPLYFGVGAGLGLFLHQIHDASPLSLDYQLLLGVRFFNLFQNTGFFIEAGMKNHVLILSQGQYNGTFAAIGAIFTF